MPELYRWARLFKAKTWEELAQRVTELFVRMGDRDKGIKERIFWLNCTNLLKKRGRNAIIIIKFSLYRRTPDEKGNNIRNL
jgi:hypothetical protein